MVLALASRGRDVNTRSRAWPFWSVNTGRPRLSSVSSYVSTLDVGSAKTTGRFATGLPSVSMAVAISVVKRGPVRVIVRGSAIGSTLLSVAAPMSTTQPSPDAGGALALVVAVGVAG